MALKEEVYSTDAILRTCFISITQKLQNSIFTGTSIKAPFASSPEMINSGIMCALCDYNENKNHHTPLISGNRT